MDEETEAKLTRISRPPRAKRNGRWLWHVVAHSNPERRKHHKLYESESPDIYLCANCNLASYPDVGTWRKIPSDSGSIVASSDKRHPLAFPEVRAQDLVDEEVLAPSLPVSERKRRLEEILGIRAKPLHPETPHVGPARKFVRRAREDDFYVWHIHEDLTAYALYPIDQENYFCSGCVHVRPDARVGKKSRSIIRTRTRHEPSARTMRNALASDLSGFMHSRARFGYPVVP